MLVSHRHKFIYTKTFKTGGTSVESYFERFCMPESKWTLSDAREESVSEEGIVGFRGPKPPKGCRYFNHMPATLIKERIGSEAWDKYFKFCVIRNPFDKAVSAIYFVLKHAKGGSLDFGDLDHQRAELERWLYSPGSQVLIDRDKYTIDGKICLDAFIRYEDLSAELERLCARLGLPWEPSRLPNFKSGVRPNTASAEKLFTEKSRKFIEDAFALELEHFKYSFPGEGH